MSSKLKKVPSPASIARKEKITENRLKRWFEKPGYTITFLVIFFPFGLYLMWKYMPWPKYIKVATTIFVLAVVVLYCIEKGFLF